MMLAMAQGFASPTDSLSTGRFRDKLTPLQKKDLILKDTTLKPIAIEPIITVTPSSLDFGTVLLGQSVTKTFTVRGLLLKSNLTLQVLSYRSSTSDGFTIDKTVITPAQARQGVTVRVTYRPQYVGTQNTTNVYISGGGAKTKIVALSGTCVDSLDPPTLVPTLTVNPTSLDFEVMGLGRTMTKTFTVRGTNLTEPLTLRVLTTRSSSSDGFSIDKTTITPAQAMEGVTVRATYRPHSFGTQNTTSVYISSSEVSQTVTLTGTCSPSLPINPDVPTITVNPSSLDFGTVAYGRSVTKTITVRGLNLSGPLTLQVLTTRSSTSDGFTIDKTTITQSQALLGATVRVTYKPLYVGTQNSTFIRISGGGAEKQDIALTGTCIESGSLLTPSFDEEDANTNGLSAESWGNATTDVNELSLGVKIFAQGHDIIIDSPVDQSAMVGDIAGHARRVNLKAGRNVIPGLTSGVHIVRVGGTTAKLLLK